MKEKIIEKMKNKEFIKCLIITILALEYLIIMITIINYIANLKEELLDYENRLIKYEKLNKMYFEDLEQLEEYEQQNGIRYELPKL